MDTDTFQGIRRLRRLRVRRDRLGPSFRDDLIRRVGRLRGEYHRGRLLERRAWEGEFRVVGGHRS